MLARYVAMVTTLLVNNGERCRCIRRAAERRYASVDIRYGYALRLPQLPLRWRANE